MWKADGLIEFSPSRPCVTNGGPVRGFGSITLESVTPVTPFPPVAVINAVCIIIASQVIEELPLQIVVLGLTLEGLPGHKTPVFRLLSKQTSDPHISLNDQFSIPFGPDTAIVKLHSILL
jgi:hypothetical protein